MNTPVTTASEPGTNDLALVTRVLLNDDRHAFTELTRRHQSTVRLLLRRLTKNDHALADDLAQETFILVYKNLRQYRGDAKFSTWIFRIAYNSFLAHQRSAQAKELHVEDSVQLEESSQDISSGSSDMKLDLQRAMACLSDSERAAIVQCYYQDLSHEEAAYVLDCPLGTVKTNVARAKEKLKTTLSAWAPAATLTAGNI
ncbi:RNA polymerase sigma factor [Solimicrobium silvestre]|uniref:RNA polymerase sigma factor n=1 Tax=Solimicrobium silvestre TaxID=2099400 RepID=A0A2S9GXC2_9BURK|nr:sigma-70 family RNA polymerase sigma factor [Solimicrobium silvestre]PRC92363.1 sigma70-ECF: RNA polymerase sigma factor, sigma-70 family [Solimicrobium silvestre]